MYVSLEEAKADLRVHHDDDDAKISLLIDAAEQATAEFLNRPLSEVTVQSENSPTDLDAVLEPLIKLGILLHIEANYERDPEDMDSMLMRWRETVYPFRSGLGV